MEDFDTITERTPKGKKSDLEKDLTQLTIPTIYYILKRDSDAEHPLTARQIAELCIKYTGQNIFNENRIKQKLNMLTGMGTQPHRNASAPAGRSEDSSLRTYQKIMESTFGGSIRACKREDPYVSKRQPHATYYFEPLLSASDLTMICGAITSNKFLSAEEKGYLISREKLLGTGVNSVYNEFAVLPPKPTLQNDEHSFRRSTADFLHIVDSLYVAIAGRYQVELHYASYSAGQQTSQGAAIAFTPDNHKRLINPYALLWNEGNLYLLATNADDPEQPRHFRVDRIFSVALVSEKTSEEETALRYATVPDIPEILLPYFKKDPYSGGYIFNAARYAAAHPLLAISFNDRDMIDCCVECTNKSLSILVDNFGTNLKLKPSPVPHAERKDYYGEPVTYYTAVIRNVHFDCMKLFMLHHSTPLTVLYPEALRDAVRKTLDKNSERLSKLPIFGEEVIQ